MTDPITLRVAARYKTAEVSLWDAAVKEVEAFNKKYQNAKKLKSPLDEKGIKVLGGLKPSKKRPFVEWVKVCCPERLDRLADDYVTDHMVKEVLARKTPLEDFLQNLDKYRACIQDILNGVAPASFTYGGFSVVNEHRMSDHFCRETLEGVDYLNALFKKRGCEKLLTEGVSSIQVVPTNDDLEMSHNTAGTYSSNTRQISLSGSTIRKGTGRFIAWVNEVFLHEFGHYIHLSYLASEAREEWDNGWKAQSDEGDVLTVNQADRHRLFEILKSNSYNVQATYGELEPDDKARYLTWLGQCSLGAAVIEPSGKSVKPTRLGKDVLFMVKHPDRFPDYGPAGMKDSDREFEQKKIDASMRRMGLDNPVLLKVSKDKAELQNLEIVSDYGKTNEKEDFAETFVAFMAAPEKLTPTAKFRMQRALSLSGLYNKPVMRLADDLIVEAVVSRYARREWP